jgi:hypothetical protein
LHLWAEELPRTLQPQNLPPGHPPQQTQGRVFRVGELALHHLIEHHRQGEKVSLGAELTSPRLFGSQVPRSPHHDPSLGQGLEISALGESQISDLGPLRCDENIRRLEISVHQAFLMNGVDSFTSLKQEAPGFLHIHPRGQASIQTVFGQFHEEVGHSLLHPSSKATNHPGMDNPNGGLEFPSLPLPAPLEGNELESKALSVEKATDFIDLAKGSLPQERASLEMRRQRRRE